MRTLNLGIAVTQHPSTMILVELPQLDAEATVRIGEDDVFTQLLAEGRGYRAWLTPGEYVLVVDSAVRPSAEQPLTVTLDADASFWSAAHPAANHAARPSQGGSGRRVAVRDPFDPWPAVPPSTPASDAFLRSRSLTATAIRNLLDANPGRPAHPGRPGPRIHALLIGIDAYQDGPGVEGKNYRNLQGCVNDILETEQLLRAQIPDLQITRLLAPSRTGPGSDLAIAPEARPTYANIVGAWRRLIDTARPGDILYIHFSGHGGQARTWFPAHKPSGLDETLAPCDVNEGRYVRDVEIALLLQRTAERGLLTTLVLDSCHAGGATRSDQMPARGGQWPDLEIHGQRASAVGTADELDAVAHRLAHHAMDATWRLDPTGLLTTSVTVLAACTQTQRAAEHPANGRYFGALSYFWRQALVQRGPTATYGQLYDQVFGHVRDRFTFQTPLLFGERDRLVFGTSVLVARPTIPVRAVRGDEIELGAGAAALIDRGSRLAIVPADQLPELAELSQLPQVEVHAVDASSARATRVGDRDNRAPIAVGAQAILRAHPPRLQRTVRLIAPAGRSPAVFGDLAARITHHLSHLLVVTAEPDADFQILIHEADRTYRIGACDGQQLRNVPSLAIDDRDTPDRLVELIVHLARHANVRALSNDDPGAPLAGKLVIELRTPRTLPGDPRPVFAPFAAHPVRIREGAAFCLRVHNQSHHPLQLTVLNLQPDWGISSVLPDYLELNPDEHRDTLLEASLPTGIADGHDALKVIATLADAGPLHASLLELPPLGQPRRPSLARGRHESTFTTLLRNLQDPEIGGRDVVYLRSPSHGWITAQTELEVYR